MLWLILGGVITLLAQAAWRRHAHRFAGAQDRICSTCKNLLDFCIWLLVRRHVLDRVKQEILTRERAVEALRHAVAKYRSIFENAIEGIFQTTPDGRYLSANPALARIYGYESTEQLIEGIGRHHPAVAEVIVRAPIEIFESERGLVPRANLFEYPLGLRNDFLADAITGDYRDFECAHETFDCSEGGLQPVNLDLFFQRTELSSVG